MIGDQNNRVPGITKKKDRNPMNVRDIDGATSKTKSYILKKVYNKKSEIETFMKSTSAIGNGMRYEPSETGQERTFDTKRFMRVNDIPGAVPKNNHSITDNEKSMILSNDQIIEQIYQNSLYYKKKRDREGKLPFTRRINKGQNLIDKSFMSTIDPWTGEAPMNPYLNISSTDRPNQRMKRSSERLEEGVDKGQNDNIHANLWAKRVASKRSHKLGLNKAHENSLR